MSANCYVWILLKSLKKGKSFIPSAFFWCLFSCPLALLSPVCPSSPPSPTSLKLISSWALLYWVTFLGVLGKCEKRSDFLSEWSNFLRSAQISNTAFLPPFQTAFAPFFLAPALGFLLWNLFQLCSYPSGLSISASLFHLSWKLAHPWWPSSVGLSGWVFVLARRSVIGIWFSLLWCIPANGFEVLNFSLTYIIAVGNIK